jgi:hypothetical protein
MNRDRIRVATGKRSRDPRASQSAGLAAVIVASLLLLVAALVLLARSTPQGQARGQRTPGRTSSPAPAPTTEDVPAPPMDLGFDSSPYSGLIEGPAETQVYVSSTTGQSADELAKQAQQVLDFYAEAMPASGWTLVQEYPIADETGDGNPEGTVGGGSRWGKNGRIVVIHASNYAQWHEWAWRLNVIVWYLTG